MLRFCIEYVHCLPIFRGALLPAASSSLLLAFVSSTDLPLASLQHVARALLTSFFTTCSSSLDGLLRPVLVHAQLQASLKAMQ